MKIACIQRFLPSESRGGVGYFTHGLCNALVKRGHHVSVFSRDRRPSDAFYEVVPVGQKRARWDFLAFPFDLARLDFSGFDMVHAQGDDQWLPRRRPPLVRTLHGSALQEALHNGLFRGSLPRFFMHLYFYANEWAAVLRADAVVGVSRDTGRYYPRMTDVIPNGIETAVYKNTSAAKSEYPSILFVGELNSRKRGDMLLRYFRRDILPALPEARLWLVCPEKINAPGVETFTQLSHDEMAVLYKRAWLFCMPSAYEGFGRPYVEAMASGTPVVSTWNAGAAEVTENSKYGVLCRDGELSAKLLEILKDESLRAQLAGAAFHYADQFDWNQIAANYEAVYERVLKKHA